MALVPRLRILLRLAGPPRAAVTRAGLLLALTLIELLGRRSGSDVADLVGIAALAVVLSVWLGADAAARGALVRLAQGLRDRVRARLATFGIDLRGEPVVPRGVPLLLRRFVILCAAVTALEALWILGVGTPFRGFLAGGSYVLLLLLTGTLWAALLATILLSVFLVAVAVRNLLRIRHGGTQARRRRLWFRGYLVVAVLGLAFAPDWLALAALVLAVVLMGMAESPRLPMLWRDRDGRVGALHLHQWFVAQALLVWWPVGIAIVSGLGGRAFGEPGRDASTPITDALAAGAAWFAGPAALLLSLLEVDLLKAMIRRDPRTPCPTAVHVTPAGGDEGRARELLLARGWIVRLPPEPPDLADVRLRLLETMPPLQGPRARWPLAVSAKALEAPELLDLIARRDVVQRRRLLLRGLRRMLRDARRRTFTAGTGFWIAPQHWFAGGLTRDTSEDDPRESEMVGEPYHVMIPLPALHHAHRVFSAVEIDIVFVEDGVTWRGLRSVLARVFAHRDRGLGRIEERDLHGVPGIRVIVHDFRLGEPLGREKYPEPDYEDLGRARVLHVFRDRGGDDAAEPVPSTDEGVPVRG